MSTLESNNERLATLMQQVHDLPPVAHEDAVLRIPQELTDTQKWQARANIGATSEDDVKTLIENAGTGGSGVQPDWNQTDETAADFIKNKPFWEKTVMGDTLTWDGNTEGLVSSADLLYKVSDVVPTMDDLSSGATVVITSGTISETVELPPDGIIDCRVDGVPVVTVGTCIFIALEDYVVNFDVPLPEKGVYFIREGEDFVSSLTIPGYTGFANTEIKQIDSKFLPNVADIPAAWIADLKAALGIA